MSRKPEQHTLGEFARAGFQSLSEARTSMLELGETVGAPISELLVAFGQAADPDTALHSTHTLLERNPELLRGLDGVQWQHLALIFGASPALAEFFVRRPETLRSLLSGESQLRDAAEVRTRLLDAVGVTTGPHPIDEAPIAAWSGDEGATRLRVRYRELLAELVLYDLLSGQHGRAVETLESIAAVLSHLADAALEAGLAVARATLIAGESSGQAVSKERVLAIDLAIIAMGKCGAEELNVVSDVDVMFVHGVCDESQELNPDIALRIATQLATETMRAIHDHSAEPPLWQVDPNLRPEGRQGPLVRSLSSMIAYYERWAKTWEFQALLKARAAAGAAALGERFVAETREMVWSSSSRDDFVGSVQRMRERVTEHIDPDELEVQLKLGPGGLRDIEFSVQLLQLVHGQYDESLRSAGTLPALHSLVRGGYVAREDGERLAHDYRVLRLLEHRLQLRELRRTALMPRDEDHLRVLARSSGLAANSQALLSIWREIRAEVRELHLKIFYAPLLNAVAALPGEEFSLGSDEARKRLQGIGFRDPDGAMRHLTALTKGNSRSARIQRNLLPVLLQWLAEGRDPDYGLLAFRKVSEANAKNTWYLRLLRDGTEAAERLTRVLSSSRFAADLLESIPSAVAWLERDELLQPVEVGVLLKEMRSLASRRSSSDSAAEALRAVHRREVLRLALGRLVFVIDDVAVARGLDAAHTALLDGLLLALRGRGSGAVSDTSSLTDFELTLIAMGRYGGGEMGFSSDIDLLAVYRAPEGANEQESSESRKQAERVMAELRRLVSDPRFSVDLDFDLRPEGKNGPIVRSLDAYRAYYERWSLTWEAQALLRARPVAGDVRLGRDFVALADRIRYPQSFGEADTREVRRIKARVEAERLPRGAEPKRHLKLGPGGISDVEWLVQLLQLQHAGEIPSLRTQSTLAALRAAVDAELLGDEDRQRLEEAWRLASRIRSAIKLWSDRASDALPHDRTELEGIAGILGMPEGRTTELEEQWFAASRRAREVYEREFFGFTPDEMFL